MKKLLHQYVYESYNVQLLNLIYTNKVHTPSRPNANSGYIFWIVIILMVYFSLHQYCCFDNIFLMNFTIETDGLFLEFKQFVIKGKTHLYKEVVNTLDSKRRKLFFHYYSCIIMTDQLLHPRTFTLIELQIMNVLIS